MIMFCRIRDFEGDLQWGSSVPLLTIARATHLYPRVEAFRAGALEIILRFENNLVQFPCFQFDQIFPTLSRTSLRIKLHATTVIVGNPKCMRI